MQQVLNYSNAVERTQHAVQGQAEEVARAFAKELEKTAEHQLSQTHATQETEQTGIRDSDQRKKKHYARHLPTPGAKSEEEKKEEVAPPAETGHGTNINVVA
ncbi:MAG: hypothetical protein HY751_10260 [Nitrospinae bacterium]|nr:hypothetical protein [Nitrospinota bacterium]